MKCKEGCDTSVAELSQWKGFPVKVMALKCYLGLLSKLSYSLETYVLGEVSDQVVSSQASCHHNR